MIDPYEYTLDELLAGIDEAATTEPDDGFLTANEWARVWQISIKRARETIAVLLENERMVRQERTDISLLSGRTIKKSVFGIVGDKPCENQ